MKFRTEYTPKKSNMILSPDKPVVLAGSCFSQNMAAKMNMHMWEAVNPLGTLYNPFSICFAIDMMLDLEKGIERFEKSLFNFNGIWNSKFFDSSFSAIEKDDCKEEFKQRRKLFISALQEGKALIITFGTSIIYYDKEEHMPIGNCHKLPPSRFYTKRMTSSEILSYCDVVLERIHKDFEDVKVIFTVSPVRHLKDGFIENSRSKAALLLGIEDIISFNEKCSYFPAFEIINDDLRDYRFYASDLAHPSDEAVDYIWEKFRETYLDDRGNAMLDEGLRKYKALNHRPKTGALGKPLV